jgi:hypothetical protein
MELKDHVALNYNNNIYTAAIILDIEKVFDTKWHADLPYELSKFEFYPRHIKLIASFLLIEN